MEKKFKAAEKRTRREERKNAPDLPPALENITDPDDPDSESRDESNDETKDE